MSVLEVMTAKEGHLTVGWDQENEQETRVARETFTRMMGKGYAAYRNTEGAAPGEQIREFDPEAENILLMPPMAAG